MESDIGNKLREKRLHRCTKGHEKKFGGDGVVIAYEHRPQAIYACKSFNRYPLTEKNNKKKSTLLMPQFAPYGLNRKISRDEGSQSDQRINPPGNTAAPANKINVCGIIDQGGTADG